MVEGEAPRGPRGRDPRGPQASATTRSSSPSSRPRKSSASRPAKLPSARSRRRPIERDLEARSKRQGRAHARRSGAHPDQEASATARSPRSRSEVVKPFVSPTASESWPSIPTASRPSRIDRAAEEARGPTREATRRACSRSALGADAKREGARRRRAHRRSRDRRRAPHRLRGAPVPRPHGVALFTRGETQAMVYTTLGSSGDEQTIDALTRALRASTSAALQLPAVLGGRGAHPARPGRREVGHGNLAERAINCRCCPTSRTSRTRSASCPRSSSRTARRRWRRVRRHRRSR